MNRFAAFSVVLVFGFAMAWAQAPAAQPAAAPAAAQTSSISGCMTQSFGIFSVPNGGKAWNVKGSGASLWSFDNHMVKVTGLVDPNAASPVLYAQSVQDTGQPCGSAATASATGTAGTAAPATTSATTAPATAQPAEVRQQPGGGVAQNTVPAPPAAAQTSAQTGTTGVTTPAPQTGENTGENKGTPAAGSPQGAIASDSSASNSGASNSTTSNSSASSVAAAPSQNYSTFNGCLLGSVNDYQFKANGKTYRLQGNTSQLMSLFKHNVEITGEDFNGKAIEVNGARDLGTSCK